MVLTMVKRVWIDSIHITWNNNYSFSTCEEREREREERHFSRSKTPVFVSFGNQRDLGERGDRFKRCSFIPRSLDSLAN